MKSSNSYAWLTVATLALSAAPVLAQNDIGTLQAANKVYGREVMSSDNQKEGNLNNLIVDLESGRILYATIGASKGTVAVPPEIFTRTPGPNDKTVQAKVTKAQIDGAPQFSNNNNPQSLGRADFISQVYQYFNQPSWWQGNQPANEGSFHNVHKASETEGMKVENASNAPLGTVNNLIVDLPAGRVAYVVLSPDSSLGLGNNLYVMPPQALTLSSDGKNLVSGIDKAQLASAPHFPKGNWPADMANRQYAMQVYQHFGKQPYFSSGNFAPTGR